MFNTKLDMIAGAALAAALFLAAGPAEAAPPEGMRWSDTVGLTSPRRPSQPQRVGPVVRSPRFYSYAPVTTVSTAPPTTVTVRGPDGVVRTYPVVIQPGAPTFAPGAASDGTVPADSIVARPCR